jgi:outer membrane autotransporter protein
MSNTAYAHLRSTALRGGRLTKFKGIAASIAPMIGAVVIAGLSAGQAQAANECGPDLLGTDTLNCAAGAYGSGITYTGSDGLILTLNDAGITVAGPGVSVTSSSAGTGAISVIGTNVGAITTTATNAYGLRSTINNTSSAATATALLKDGEVVTTGSGSVGIRAGTNGLGAALAQMDGGSVRAPVGLYSFVNNTSSIATATALLNDGVVVTTGSSSIGVHAQTLGLGATLAQMDGGSVTMEGIRADGLRSTIGNTSSAATATALLNDGVVKITSDNTYGVYAETLGLGATLAQMDGGSVTMEGRGAFALYSEIDNTSSAATATALLKDGDVVTTGIAGHGVYAFTAGLGATLAQMDGGSVTTGGRGGHGLESLINNTSSIATATALLNDGVVVTTGSSSLGVYARTIGLGATLVQMDGGSITTGENSAFGLYSEIGNTSSTATATALLNDGDVKTTGGNAYGVYARTFGIGLATATASGTSTVMVSGMQADGIRTRVSQAGASYAAAVTDTAVVTGGSGDGSGIRTESVAASSGTISVGVDATVDGSAGAAGILDDAGDTVVDIAGTVIGDVELGEGSDTLAFAATADMSGIVLLDGGDDAATADGWIDALTLTGQTFSSTGANITNWETLIIDGGSLELTDGVLTVGSDAGTGLSLTNGGALDAGGAFALTGNLMTSTGGTFDGAGGDIGDYSISGSVLNNGIITTQDAVVGDVITVAGDYSGTGMLLLDANTSMPAADTLIIEGSVQSAGTTVRAQSITSQAPLSSDIVAVTVNGTSMEGDFVGALTSGAFDYSLLKDGNNFVFSATAVAINSTGAVYETAPSILGAYNRLPTLGQRVGQRQWAGQSVARAEGQPITGGWLRFTGDKFDATTTTGSSIDGSTWGLQTGADFAVEPGDAGQWVLGITGQYGKVRSTVTSALGFGTIDSEGFGVGATATWYGNAGTYVDLQGQVNWIDSDFASSAAGSLAEGERSKAYALSAEVGHRYDLNQNTTLVPQAQLTFGSVDGGSFTDSPGNAVDLGSNNSTIARLGLAYEYENNSETGGNREKLYVIGNILHDFSSDSSVDVAWADLSTGAGEATWGEIGVGGSVTMNDATTLYGEASYRSAFSGGSDNSGLALTAGLRMQW